jgi:hypothetical protein
LENGVRKSQRELVERRKRIDSFARAVADDLKVSVTTLEIEFSI